MIVLLNKKELNHIERVKDDIFIMQHTVLLKLLEK